MPGHEEYYWEERKVFSNKKGKIIGEWQSARCPFCNKYHTTPYTYYFDNYNFCPSCGHDMRVKNENN